MTRQYHLGILARGAHRPTSTGDRAPWGGRRVFFVTPGRSTLARLWKSSARYRCVVGAGRQARC